MCIGKGGNFINEAKVQHKGQETNIDCPLNSVSLSMFGPIFPFSIIPLSNFKKWSELLEGFQLLQLPAVIYPFDMCMLWK